MVFQTRKNRHCARPSPGKSTLTGLPDELLLNILQYTDVTGVLRLRETSKSVVPACTEAIRDKLKVLYVHPCPSSVQRAISICSSDLSSEVNEICFISKNFHAMHDHEHGHSDTGPATLPWPITEPLDKEVGHAGRWEDAHMITKFRSSYRELLSSLATLKTTTFSFSESCDKPGFNMISAQRIASWRKTVEPEAPSKERRAENNLYGAKLKLLPQTRFQFADCDALASLLGDTDITFTRLKITHELAFVGCASSLGLTHIDHYRPLTALELTVSHGGRYHSPWESPYGEMLKSTADTLIELKLNFTYRSATPVVNNGGRQGSGLMLMLHLLCMPELRRLELCRFPAPDSGVSARNPNAFMLLHMPLGVCLVDQCRKLRRLKLVNVIMLTQHQRLATTPWTMDDDVLNFGTAGREIEGLDRESTRAWEIDFGKLEGGAESL